jgi:hypothetical protein
VAVNLDDRRFLPEGDFRSTRHYLADHAFAIAPGESVDPTDPIDQETWDGVMVLPTDVLLRTTDYQGSLVEDTHAQWAAWIHALPTDPSVAPFMFEAAWDATDEFSAAPFIAAHGWYRQATGALRTALESLVIAAGYAVRVEDAGLARWRAGVATPGFKDARRSGRRGGPTGSSGVREGRRRWASLRTPLPLRPRRARAHERRHVGKQRPCLGLGWVPRLLDRLLRHHRSQLPLAEARVARPHPSRDGEAALRSRQPTMARNRRGGCN